MRDPLRLSRTSGEKKPSLATRIKAQIWALLPPQWRGAAGTRFTRTIKAISDYSQTQIRPGERIEEAPELLWNFAKGSANEKQSRVLVNYQDEESKRINNKLAIATLRDKARQEKATATRLEAEAGIAQTKEIEARVDLVLKLKNLGVGLLWDDSQRMSIVKVGPEYNWNGLKEALLLSETSNDAGKVETDPNPPSEPSQSS